GDGVRAIPVASEELEAERLEPGLRRACEPGVTLVHVLQALLLEHAQAFLHREGDRYRGREGRHPLLRPGLRLLPVEVEARGAGFRLLRPRTLADADERKARRRHPALLRPADGDVDAPGVGLDGDRADGADAIDDHYPVGVPAGAGELAQRVGEPGRGLVVG